MEKENIHPHPSEKKTCTDCGYEGHEHAHPSDHPMRNKETYKGSGVFGNEV